MVPLRNALGLAQGESLLEGGEGGSSHQNVKETTEQRTQEGRPRPGSYTWMICFFLSQELYVNFTEERENR